MKDISEILNTIKKATAFDIFLISRDSYHFSAISGESRLRASGRAAVRLEPVLGGCWVCRLLSV